MTSALPAAAQTEVYDLPATETLLALLGILPVEEDIDYAELAVLG